MTKTDQKDSAPQADTAAMMGRFDVLEKQGDTMSNTLSRLADAIEAMNTSVASLETKFGQLVVGAPKSDRAQKTLTRTEIEDILRKRPSASFRLLQAVQSPSFTRSVGAIIRPQTMLPSTWQALLQQQVKLEDADENP
jgi:hypothetical protein